MIWLSGLIPGNGTQAIVEQIADDGRPAPKIFYGSMHDILSYPCEVRYFRGLLELSPNTLPVLRQVIKR